MYVCMMGNLTLFILMGKQDGGEVWSSGDDTHGQLGHHTSQLVTHNTRAPARVDLNGARAIKVVCGTNFSLAVTTGRCMVSLYMKVKVTKRLVVMCLMCK